MSTKKGILEKIWSMCEEKLDASKQKKARKALQLQAEVHIGGLTKKVDLAEQDYEKSLKESKDTMDFEKISLAALSKKSAEKVRDEAVEVYTEIFETEPKLV